MGRISMSMKAAGLVAAALLLAGCPRPDQDDHDRTTAPPGGDTIICPGDSRCVDIFPITDPTIAPAPAPALPPQATTCLVNRERVVVACPGNGDQRCPGPGCPNGQNPGQGGGPGNNCRITEHYYDLNCEALPNAGVGSAPDESAPSQ